MISESASKPSKGMGRLCPEIQHLTLSSTIFDRKGTPFIYLWWKMVPLSHTYRRVRKSNKLQFFLPFYILQIVKSLPFHIRTAWKWYPFQEGTPCDNSQGNKRKEKEKVCVCWGGGLNEGREEFPPSIPCRKFRGWAPIWNEWGRLLSWLGCELWILVSLRTEPNKVVVKVLLWFARLEH